MATDSFDVSSQFLRHFLRMQPARKCAQNFALRWRETLDDAATALPLLGTFAHLLLAHDVAGIRGLGAQEAQQNRLCQTRKWHLDQANLILRFDMHQCAVSGTLLDLAGRVNVPEMIGWPEVEQRFADQAARCRD